MATAGVSPYAIGMVLEFISGHLRSIDLKISEPTLIRKYKEQ